MTATAPEPDDLEPIGTDPALQALQERLKARGYELTPASELDTPTHVTETEADKAQRLAARQAVYRARWEAQVPPMFRDARLADLDESQAVTWERESLNLVLAGPVGTGKTHAAYAFGNEMAQAGRWVCATTVVDLLAAMRPDGDPGLVKAAQECAILILDDLGAGKASEFAVEQMTALLDRRVREERHTIVTTNVPEGDLEAAWGGRFMDRLRFKRTVKVFSGPSRRKAAW
jgi:DNA replication protein DnaC